MDNNDSTNGGYYIELEGLNTTQLGGNITIEMVIRNDELTVTDGGNTKNKKSLSRPYVWHFGLEP